MYDWDFNSIIKYLPALLKGAIITIQLSFLSILFGTILGLILSFTRYSRFLLARVTSKVIIEVFLALPVLVLLIWAYYCLPLLGLKFNEFWTVIFVFSISLSAFIAETMRSGYDAIPSGQIEAAKTLLFSKIQIFRFIILPQGFRIILPALLTQYITTIKMTTLASVIAVYELLHTANNIAMQTYRSLEVYTVIAIFFLIIIIPINIFTRRIERKWIKKELI
jgi:polar amino acid transport system permease protein